MKISELRIGNYIRHNVIEDGTNKYIEPNEDVISEDDLWHFIGGIGFDKEEPIPITEEWLTKLGFTCSEGVCELENNDTGIEDGWMLQWDSENDLWLYPCIEGKIRFDHIKFVHQLQNLYFALTGKEFELKS